MSVKEEIDKLWNQEGLPLNKFYSQALELLQNALNNSQAVPTELLVETIVSANTSTGFGSTFDDAKLLFQAFSVVIKEDNPGKIPKFYRLCCLIISVILTLLSVDEFSTKKELKKILKHLNIDTESSRINVIKSLLSQFTKILDNFITNYWSLELLSFLTMLYGYIDEYGTTDDQDLKVYEKIKGLNWTEKDQTNLSQWKDRWLEANDYFRLNGMMIFAKPPRSEDTLLKRLEEVYTE